MPRFRRLSVGGLCYHAMVRCNPGLRAFETDRDCRAFMELMAEANERLPMRIISYCLMPNHGHFVLWPKHDGDMSRWMHWLLSTHARRHHLRHGTYGRLWQGRFKAFPIQMDGHLIIVIRYVERNPLRAGLVFRAEDWPWSSLRHYLNGTARDLLHEGPVSRGERWAEFVNEPLTPGELKAVRTCANRERPYGDELWVNQTAEQLGLSFTQRDPGRPTREIVVVRKAFSGDFGNGE